MVKKFIFCFIFLFSFIFISSIVSANTQQIASLPYQYIKDTESFTVLVGDFFSEFDSANVSIEYVNGNCGFADKNSGQLFVNDLTEEQFSVGDCFYNVMGDKFYDFGTTFNNDIGLRIALYDETQHPDVEDNTGTRGTIKVRLTAINSTDTPTPSWAYTEFFVYFTELNTVPYQIASMAPLEVHGFENQSIDFSDFFVGYDYVSANVFNNGSYNFFDSSTFSGYYTPFDEFSVYLNWFPNAVDKIVFEGNNQQYTSKFYLYPCNYAFGCADTYGFPVTVNFIEEEGNFTGGAGAPFQIATISPVYLGVDGVTNLYYSNFFANPDYSNDFDIYQVQFEDTIALQSVGLTALSGGGVVCSDLTTLVCLNPVGDDFVVNINSKGVDFQTNVYLTVTNGFGSATSSFLLNTTSTTPIDEGIVEGGGDGGFNFVSIVSLINGVFPSKDTLSIKTKMVYVFIVFVLTLALLFFILRGVDGFRWLGYIGFMLLLVEFFFFIAIGYISTSVLIILVLVGISISYFKFKGGNS